MHININLSDYMINIDKLRNLVRYQNAPRVSEETVAEHSFFVSAYVLKLHNYYNFDLKKALSIAILHDYAEVFISDIPHPIKKQFPVIEDCLKEAENKIIKEHISDDFSNWLSEFNNINTAEGCIVSLADILSVISYSKYEIELGNSKYMKDVLEKAIKRAEYMFSVCEKYLYDGITTNSVLENINDFAYKK